MTTRRFKRYPAYKDSGVVWLGEIPAHWEIAPVYARYEVALGKMLDATRVTGEFSGPYLRNVDVQWDMVNTEGLPEMDFAPWERDRYLVRPGDLLVCEGGEVGRTAIWPGKIEPCYYQKALHRVRPRANREDPRFFLYLMYMVAKRGVFAGSGNQNTIDHLTAVQLKHYRFPFAPEFEQRAIAAFLDTETARIDALVAKKERLIALLQEQRTSVITRAVTRGLDPSAHVSDTSSNVFPQIPAGWELRKLRRLITRVARPVKVDPDGEYREIGIRSWGRGIFHKDAVRGALLEDKSVYAIEPGDFVLNIVFAWEGAVAIASEAERGMVGSHRFPTFRCSNEVDLDYLLMVFQTEQGRALMEVNSPGAAGRNKTIRLDQFLDEAIPLPKVAEQREIVRQFRNDEGRLVTLLDRLKLAIQGLKELRTALITAAVTGKIDVREEAA